MRIGIDLGGTKIEGIALDGSGREVGRERVPTPRGDYDGTIGAIADIVRRLEARHGGPASVGVGIPGVISPQSGLVKNANSTWLIGRRFDEDLASALRRPVRTANDANCFTLSEATDGAGAGAPVVFGVILGTGVGGGVVVRGRIVEGANRIAGEWGHNPLPWPAESERPGPACYCGRTGCIETFLSGPGLARDYSTGVQSTGVQSTGVQSTEVQSTEVQSTGVQSTGVQSTGVQSTEVRIERRFDAAEIARLAAEGEPAAAAALARYINRLARALASVINVLDPDIIVLGGGLSQIGALYEGIPAQWGEYVFSDTVLTRLAPARHGATSGVRGAAWLW